MQNLTGAISNTKAQQGARTVRYWHLDATRGVAALYVAAHHAMLTLYPSGTTNKAWSWLNYGHFAVAVFIVLSGYSLAQPVINRQHRLGSLWTYAQRRFKRIVPTYMAALAIAVLLDVTVLGQKTGSHWDVCVPLTLSSVAVNFALLQDLINVAPPNHVFWSVALEAHIYFLFPLLVFLRRQRHWVFLAGAAVAGVLVGPATSHLHIPFFTQPQLFSLFVIGMLAADLPAAMRVNAKVTYATTGILVLSGAVLAALIGVGGFSTVNGHLWAVDPILGLAVAAVLALANDHAPGAPPLWARPAAKLGIFSYSIYLMHAPLIQLVWQYGVRHLGYGAGTQVGILLVMLVPVVAVAWVFYVLVERPLTTRRASDRTWALTLRPFSGSRSVVVD